MKWLRRAGLGLLALLLLAAATFAVYRSRALPVVDGALAVAGVAGPIRVERDTHGIPTISAQSHEDAAFGLGFVHAQDRLWQLETHKRIGAGRLAEAFGPGALENDKFLRALGVRRAAAAQWQNASAESKRLIEAYTAGVNAFMREHLRARPPEFLILGLQPEPWQPVDSLAWTAMMAYDLGGNWASELLRMRLALKLPTSRIDELMPPYPGDKPLPVRDYAALYRELKVDGNLGSKALLHAPESHVEGVGSNNWVVAGTHSVDRQAAARQRSAPEADGAAAVVLRTHRHARRQGRRRDDARRADGRARPERPSRVGLDQYQPRRAGPVPRTHRRQTTHRATRRPTAGRRSSRSTR